MADYVKVPIGSLQTPRLHLRPLQYADAPRIQEIFPHWNVLKYMNSAIPWPYPAGGAMEFLRRVLPKQEKMREYYWAILLKENPELGLIGVIGLTPSSEEDHRGFWLAEEFWGRGYMKEAVAATLDFAFGILRMNEMLLNNAEPNMASHRLKDSSGAEIIAVEEQSYISGTFPGIRWRLTAESWMKHREGFLKDTEKG